MHHCDRTDICVLLSYPLFHLVFGGVPEYRFGWMGIILSTIWYITAQFEIHYIMHDYRLVSWPAGLAQSTV